MNTRSKLEARIAATYAKGTDATNKNALYDSYIKAFRWASDRIKGGGVIGFVTNAGWLDGAAMDGLRKCFVKEFSAIYVFNLRGNARTQGELRRKESGNVFGSGSRAPIAITILVKIPEHSGDAEIFYRDIGDYLTREQKIDIINRTPDVFSAGFNPLVPNAKADWINQRGDAFDSFISLAPNKKFDGNAQSFFITYSNGLKTQRDAWMYNFSERNLLMNVERTINAYNSANDWEFYLTKDIVWTRATKTKKMRYHKMTYKSRMKVEAMYRPFCKEYLYYDTDLIEMIYQIKKFFPNGDEKNLLICVTPADEGKFSALITDKITDLHFNGDTQCFPLYWYEKSAQGNLFGENYQRRDGVSDFILQRARELYGVRVDKADVFYYVYGFLHLPLYREKFANELRYSLPRIILVDDAQKFWHLSRAGRELAEIHLNYESQPPAQVEIVGTEQNDYRVQKMRFAKDDRTTLIYNRHIKIKHIPPRSFDYVVNGRSPLEWLIDRYQVKTDKASGIINDANAWGIEHGDSTATISNIFWI